MPWTKLRLRARRLLLITSTHHACSLLAGTIGPTMAPSPRPPARSALCGCYWKSPWQWAQTRWPSCAACLPVQRMSPRCLWWGIGALLSRSRAGWWGPPSSKALDEPSSGKEFCPWRASLPPPGAPCSKLSYNTERKKRRSQMKPQCLLTWSNPEAWISHLTFLITTFSKKKN